jgi:hypothetical protein
MMRNFQALPSVGHNLVLNLQESSNDNDDGIVNFAT